MAKIDVKEIGINLALRTATIMASINYHAFFLLLVTCKFLNELIYFRLHEVNEGLTELPELENPQSEKLRTFIQWLNGQKPYPAPIKIIR